MNRMFWTVLNLVLFAVGAWATWAMLRQPAESEQVGTAAPSAARSPHTTKQPVAARATGPDDELVKMVAADIDTLWRQTLFNPQRSEEVAAENESAAPAKPDAFDFELIGIGVIGKRAAAVIWVHRKGVVRTRVIPRRGAVYARSARSRAAKKESPKKEGPHVYKLGDAVEDTGYTVKEIHLDKVVLVRGDETKVLTLDRSDETSKKRTEAAAREEAKREQARKARAAAVSGAKTPRPVAKHGAAPLQPPPPPPAPAPPPGVGAGKPVGRLTPSQKYEERFRKAFEARRRILGRGAASPK